jgi:hypothetical protein
MGKWLNNSKVKNAGASATLNNLYVTLVDDRGNDLGYFTLAPTHGNHLLVTALTALSQNLTVDAFVGEQGEPTDSVGYFYCYVLYVYTKSRNPTIASEDSRITEHREAHIRSHIQTLAPKSAKQPAAKQHQPNAKSGRHQKAKL